MLILLQCILKPGPTLELPVLEEEVYGDAQGAKQVGLRFNVFFGLLLT